MKINHNCIEYRLSQHLAIWEIETEDAYEYYVEVKGYPIAFSFGSSKDNKNPRFDEESLLILFRNDYFRPTLEDIVDDLDELRPLYKELNVPKLDVYSTGGGWYEASLYTDGGVYVVCNEFANCLSFYSVDDRKCEELFMEEDMVFSLDRGELQNRALEIYNTLHSELMKKSLDWHFNMNYR